MRIPRIHLPLALRTGAIVALGEGAANHVLRVLRLRPGAAVVVFNGEGGEFEGVLVHADRRRVEVELRTRRERGVESPLAITLAQGISRGERMDYTIQKAVELGVHRIVPLVTERSMVSLAGERRDKRLRHWQSVAASACEQCGRNLVPEVAEVCGLDEWLNDGGEELRLVLHHRAAGGLARFAAPQGAVTLLIGPEGGLSPAEIERAQHAGYAPVRLGPRVLRTETAAVVALAAMQSLWGDLLRELKD
jgi:16S rRNA (uracil1498-N3)-methyltransferase